MRKLIHPRRGWWWIAMLAGVASLAAWWNWPRSIEWLDEPQQHSISPQVGRIDKQGWQLTPLATFRIHARVLGVKKYSVGDTAALAPYDLALGWGLMADHAVLERIEISQAKRFYRWRYWGKEPLPEKDIIRYSTNAHVIPADEKVMTQVAALKEGDFIELAGYLVEATHPRADKPWRSSLLRDDRGEGACEIIYAKALQHISGRSRNL